MKLIYIVFLLLLAIQMMACSPSSTATVPTSTPTSQGAYPNPNSATIEPSLTSVPSLGVTPLITPTVTLVPSDTTVEVAATEVVTPGVSATESFTTVVQPTLVAAILPDLEWRSTTPDNVWWSDDSQTLFYQDEKTRQAWSYDINNETTREVAYTARSLIELKSELEFALPDNASIVAISPRNRYVLFSTPLLKLVPLEPPRFDNEDVNPAFSDELWLFKDGQTYNLGLVDHCFFLHMTRWSMDENKSFVNTYFTFDVERACMFTSWLIDGEALRVGAFPITWEGETDYTVLDLSVNGRFALVQEVQRNKPQYLIELETGVQTVIPDSEARGILVESELGFASLVYELEFTGIGSLTDNYFTHVRYVASSAESAWLLTSLHGEVSQWLVSPNQEFVVFILSSIDGYRIMDDNIEAGIWLVKLP